MCDRLCGFLFRRWPSNASPGQGEDNPGCVADFDNLNDPQPTLHLVRALHDFLPLESGDLEFNAGDILEVIQQDYGDWWIARHVSSSETGAIPSNYVVKYDSGQVCENDTWWFDGERQQAETLLMLPGNKRGSFLIRYNRDRTHKVLSVRNFDETTSDVSIKHYEIKESDNELYISTKKTFLSIQQLIDYYSGIDAEAHGMCCRLTDACQRRPEIVPFKHFEVDRSELQLVEVIGKGHFGCVWRGKWRNTVEVAVKQLNDQDSVRAEQFLEEAKVLHKLRHQHLVMLMGVCTVDKPFFIIMELVKHGNLHKYLQTVGKTKLPYRSLMEMASQVADGMAHLEKSNYVHRDLRSENVLVADTNMVKIGDVGLARLLTEGIYTSHDTKWPARWTAPEAYKEQEFTVKSDVWSFGILLHEIVTYGELPYKGMTNMQVIIAVCGNDSTDGEGYRLPNPASSDVECPDDLYSVMTECWRKNPHDRPTFDKLLKHFRNSPDIEVGYE